MHRSIPGILGLVLLAGCSAPSSHGLEARATDPLNCVYSITLSGAMPNKSDMVLHLNCNNGMFGRATAKTPRFTRAAHTATADKLKLEGNSLAGDLDIIINSDGYVPANWQTEKCRYRISAEIKDGTVTGSYEGEYGKTDPKPVKGTVSGSIQAPRKYDGLLRLRLGMENAKGEVRARRASFGSRGFLNLTFRNGKAVHGMIRGHGGNPINYFEAAVTGMDLAIADNALTGTLEVKGMWKADKNQPAALATYVYTIDAAVAGDQVGGTFGKRFNGKDFDGGPLSGQLTPAPDVSAGNALYYLELHDAVAKTKHLTMYLAAYDGKFGEGAGFSGTWNHTFHDIYADKLTLNGSSLAGDIKATLNPDPYVPADKKPVPCAYTIDATIRDGYVTGTHTGTYKDEKVSGAVTGELRVRADIPEPVRISVKLDNGVCDGAPWHRRCYIGFVAKDGKTSEGGISNNKGGFKGRFQGATVERLDESTFKAAIKANVYESGKVLKGDYVFHLNGKVIGNELVGKVDTELNGKSMKKGTDFMGSFKPGK